MIVTPDGWMGALEPVISGARHFIIFRLELCKSDLSKLGGSQQVALYQLFRLKVNWGDCRKEIFRFRGKDTFFIRF